MNNDGVNEPGLNKSVGSPRFLFYSFFILFIKLVCLLLFIKISGQHHYLFKIKAQFI